jgi:hypothetical protein
MLARLYRYKHETVTYFDLRSSNPTDGREFVMKEQVIGLIIKSPLTDCQGCSRILDSLHNLNKLVLFVLVKEFVVFNGSDVQLMLGLWLWWFKWTSQDRQLDVLEMLYNIMPKIDNIKIR